MISISLAGKIFNKVRAYSNNAHGFTFMEILLVVMLIGMIAALVVPISMGTIDRVEQATSVRKVTSILRSARSEAISHKAPVAFHADMDTSQYWVANLRTEATSDAYELDDDIHFAEFTDGDARVQDGIFSIIFYPQGNTSGGWILLEPDDEDTDRQFFISVDAVTGKAKVVRDAE